MEEPHIPFRSHDMSAPKSTKKTCRVCGDKALGYNFNAITCESCKAFFRRNAQSSKKFNCPFKRNCDVTIVTRKFCQKCRLDKCFAVGMCQNLIMTEEQKSTKRRKILENKSRRPDDVPSSDSCLMFDRSDKHQPCIEANEHNTPINWEEFASITSDNCLVDFGAGPNMFDRPGSLQPFNVANKHATPINWEEFPSMTSDSCLVDFGEISSRESGPEMFDRSGNEANKHTTPIKWEPTNPGLDADEILRLEELLEANEAYDSAPNESAGAATLPSFVQYASMKIERLSKFTGKLRGFRALCRADQSALLRRAGLDVLLLKKVIDSVNPDTKRLEIRNSTFRSTLEGVRLAQVDYEALRACIRKFDRECLRDKNIILILCAVALFSSDRPNVVHREVVEREQRSYRSLLRKYLTSVCGESEVESMFEGLMEKLVEVRRASEGFIEVPLKVNIACIEKILSSRQ